MQQAKFLQGSVLKHVMTMSATNAIGISALFWVDLVDIYFISLLGNPALTAAIGYATALLFFTTSISIGLVAANSANVAKAIGQKKSAKACRYVSHISLYALCLTSFLSLLLWCFVPQLLTIIGAKGEALNAASSYLRIILPSFPILAVAMQMGATLRAVGDGKAAMLATLGGGLVNALLDPIFIFLFQMDLQGAAIASFIARFFMLAIGFYFVFFKYKILTFPRFDLLQSDIKKISVTAIPAILTQIATPIGNLYVTYEVAKFGNEYIAGWAIIGRLIPVAFGLMFAISGAIGPIIGQNYGALKFNRVRKVLNESLKFITSYTLVVALFLSLTQDMIVTLFNAQNQSAEIIRIFCQYIAISFIFSGITFITMAFLNNLGYAKYATFLNVGKMTLGTIPFVSIGALYFQAPGILYGQAFGNIIFGIFSLLLTYKIMSMIEKT
ncbi:MAG TPA: MATE family efflux transporter [Psychromonas sp.]